MEDGIFRYLDVAWLYIAMGLTFIADFVYGYKTIIAICVGVCLLFYRVLLANLTYVRRNDKQDWVVFGILFVANIISAFIYVHSVWLVAQLVIIGAAIIYAVIRDKLEQVTSTIREGGIIYDNKNDQFDNNKGEGAAERRERKKYRDNRIKRRWSADRMHWSMGVPVFATNFYFKTSTTATVEQISKVISNLNKYYDQYNFSDSRTKNGIKTKITAELIVNKVRSIPFDKDISDQLDWCIVPLGAVDVANNKTIKDTPYVWTIHDPKKEGKTFDCLKNTKTYPPSPHCYVVGQTGGGKSVLVNNMLAHWINKAKQDKQTELYLCDAKRVEFKPYLSLEEVAGVAFTLQEAVDLTNDFVEEMHKRNKLMGDEGGRSLPLDGHVTYNRHIRINDVDIPGMTVIEYRTEEGGPIKKDRAMNLDGRTDIVEINIPEMGEEKEEEEESSSSGWF